MADKKTQKPTDKVESNDTPEGDFILKKLESGEMAKICKPLGGHFMRAQRMAKHTSDIMPFLVILVTTVNGKKITINDLKTGPASDLMMLMGVVSGFKDVENDEEDEGDADFLSPMQNT